MQGSTSATGTNKNQVLILEKTYRNCKMSSYTAPNIKSRAEYSKYWVLEHNNELWRILSYEARMKAILLQMAEGHTSQATESQLSLLKRAATILQSMFLNLIQSRDTIFIRSITVDNENASLELETFFQWLLDGAKDFNTTINDDVKCLAGSISWSIIYNTK